jgi:uncharacterized protein YqiB (DUF1249 family)
VQGTNPIEIFSKFLVHAETNYLNYTIETLYTVIFNIGDEAQEESSHTRISVRLHHDAQSGKYLLCFKLLSGNATAFENCKNTLKTLF